jgi:hypothetical protein
LRRDDPNGLNEGEGGEGTRNVWQEIVKRIKAATLLRTKRVKRVASAIAPARVPLNLINWESLITHRRQDFGNLLNSIPFSIVSATFYALAEETQWSLRHFEGVRLVASSHFSFSCEVGGKPVQKEETV